MNDRRSRYLAKLQVLWDAHPTLRFGQLVEAVENVGWTILFEANPKIQHSTRLCNLGDDVFEEAVNQILADKRDMRKELRGI